MTLSQWTILLLYGSQSYSIRHIRNCYNVISLVFSIGKRNRLVTFMARGRTAAEGTEVVAAATGLRRFCFFFSYSFFFLTFFFSPRSWRETNENELKFNNKKKKRESRKTSRFPHNKARMESQLASAEGGGQAIWEGCGDVRRKREWEGEEIRNKKKQPSSCEKTVSPAIVKSKKPRIKPQST